MQELKIIFFLKQQSLRLIIKASFKVKNLIFNLKIISIVI